MLILPAPYISESCIKIEIKFLFSQFFVVPQKLIFFSSSGIGTGKFNGYWGYQDFKQKEKNEVFWKLNKIKPHLKVIGNH